MGVIKIPDTDRHYFSVHSLQLTLFADSEILKKMRKYVSHYQWEMSYYYCFSLQRALKK